MLQGSRTGLLNAALLMLALLHASPGLAAGAEPAPLSEDTRALQERKAAQQARIDALQERGDAHSPELQEAWLDLGSTLQAMEQYDAAIKAFDAAWQAARSSGGLEDPAQLPALRRLLLSQRAAGEWEAADTTAHLIHHIGSRAHAPGSPERLDTVLQLGRWKLLAASDQLLPNTLGAASEAAALYRNEIRKLEAMDDYPGRNIQLATLYLDQASAEFLLANEINDQPLRDYIVGGRSTNTVLQCTMTRLPDGRAQQICMPVEVPNVDYYVDPSNRKNQEIAHHLDDMRDGIQKAYGYLSRETELVEQRDVLLEDMQLLTTSYNEFMNGKRR